MSTTIEFRMHQAANTQSHKSYLKKILGTIFPSDYIQLHHTPPHTICSLFNFKSTVAIGQVINTEASPVNSKSHSKLEGIRGARADKTKDGERYQASTEPMSRAELVHLRQRFNCSLIEHQAKPVGLCPIRRILYDQMFDELIRQVTVGCIEQGLLLYRIRNEIWHTIDCYKKIYKSGVIFGLNKAIKAELTLNVRDVQAQKSDHEEEIDVGQRSSSRKDEAGEGPNDDRGFDTENNSNRLAWMETYYKQELAKRDQIIEQQRLFIRTLSQESINGVKSLTR